MGCVTGWQRRGWSTARTHIRLLHPQAAGGGVQALPGSYAPRPARAPVAGVTSSCSVGGREGGRWAALKARRAQGRQNKRCNGWGRPMGGTCRTCWPPAAPAPRRRCAPSPKLPPRSHCRCRCPARPAAPAAAQSPAAGRPCSAGQPGTGSAPALLPTLLPPPGCPRPRPPAAAAAAAAALSGRGRSCARACKSQPCWWGVQPAPSSSALGAGSPGGPAGRAG